MADHDEDAEVEGGDEQGGPIMEDEYEGGGDDEFDEEGGDEEGGDEEGGEEGADGGEAEGEDAGGEDGAKVSSVGAAPLPAAHLSFCC